MEAGCLWVVSIALAGYACGVTVVADLLACRGWKWRCASASRWDWDRSFQQPRSFAAAFNGGGSDGGGSDGGGSDGGGSDGGGSDVGLE